MAMRTGEATQRNHTLSRLVPGRGCPDSYGYGAAALSGPATLHADTLWVAGGLYGNALALEALLEAFDAEAGAKAPVRRCALRHALRRALRRRAAAAL